MIGSAWLWVAMAIYGVVMLALSPVARRFGEFFAGRSADGREIGTGMLVGSVVISWLFAKSITNAANLGESYGLVGAIAYAGWYVSIPVAGLVIYRLRTVLGVGSLAEFLTRKYGRAATGAFTLVILLRLFNEVWSNTAVVGSYFGEAGSTPYYGAALAFAAITLAYSLRGGLRSSILTDAIQLGLALFLLVFVLGLVTPEVGVRPMLTAGEWSLAGGMDLLLVALIQSFSYPFHDPVLTDRAFITSPKRMLGGYLLAGVIAAIFIVLFGLVGVYAAVQGVDAEQDAPLKVARAFGVGATAVMSVLMMVSAGSTLDSTLSSFSRVAAVDVAHRTDDSRALVIGRWAMFAAVVAGSLPLFAGAKIISATTVSGTMVLGLAPPFLLHAWRRSAGFAFHLSFWPGLAAGIAYAAKLVPDALALGDGPYAALLGVNVYATAASFAGFGVGTLIDAARDAARPGRGTVATTVATGALTICMLVGPAASAEPAAPSPPEDGDATPTTSNETVAASEQPGPADTGFRFGGQAMLRLTLKLDSPERPSFEVYNVRLLGTRTFDRVTLLSELRFRQTPLRSYSPSNIWIQQAYVRYDAPTGVGVAAGLIYNQVGRFWDGSWFGNLPYLNGHKLDPDMNIELSYDGDLSDVVGLRAWVQVSPAEDGLNGTFATADKEDALLLTPDPEVSSDYRESWAFRARVVPTLDLGPVQLSPGVSAQHALIDTTDPSTGDDVTGAQTVLAAELSAVVGPVELFGEVLHETVRDLTDAELTRTFVVGGAEWTVLERDTRVPRTLVLGTSYQHVGYDPERVGEWLVTSRAHVRWHDLVGTTVEYVRWEFGDLARPVVDRIEVILHGYF